MLREGISRLRFRLAPIRVRRSARGWRLLVWSTVHGLAVLMIDDQAAYERLYTESDRSAHRTCTYEYVPGTRSRAPELTRVLPPRMLDAIRPASLARAREPGIVAQPQGARSRHDSSELSLCGCRASCRAVGSTPQAGADVRRHCLPGCVSLGARPFANDEILVVVVD